ncbi:MAG: response regulator [Gammaproteobacteria bacterium]|jgi:PAS domain S-box-containing protein|nr:response regulator [Gammaproteobacteria bacterium]MBU2122094.1 response regulator [Gammaproteobacteria bacterium]MBU2170109.1 response regulator [Gammaproteobacteria bacterium]MBU2202669.1 response regulator [Gammaproteobacteria bacterium]MBU2276409.1 response regulator [Gammaproteobacteria bacterium]
MAPSAIISSSIHRDQHRVLVVDDNPVTCYSTARVLRAAGFRTLEVGTGSDAIEAARDDVSAIVLDVNLPDMDGFEVCRILRADPRTQLTPIIHLSATYIQSEHKVEGLNAGSDAYLVHPAEPPLMVATLQALIRARTAEEELRRSGARFRAIYDRAPVAMMLIDAEGHFADVNPAAEILLQRNRQELIGLAVTSLAPEPWRDFVHEGMNGHADANWQGKFPLIRGDGQEMLLDWSMSDHVEPGVRIGIATDLSERIDFERRREDLLEREQSARVLAERHSRTKDDFVAVLSHELRTPLTLITGWVHMLKRPSTGPDFLARGIDAIERGVKAQGRIISDILDVSRIASGKLRLHREWADPVELTRISLGALNDVALAKNINLEVHSTGVDEAAWLDVTRFQQIVWNLVTNAIKFSENGATVRLDVIREGDALTLAVTDQGHGIEPEFVPHIFERFTQSGAPGNRGHGGLGLGLSIVKHLVELHGGSVCAYSKGLGHGTTMTAKLLVSYEDPGATTSDAMPLPLSGEKRLLDGKDILVVEDNADTSEMLSIVLTDEGATVRVANSYQAAIAQFEHAWPELLVSDIGLPGKDGYDLIAKVREMESQENRPRTRAIALTAFARPQDRDRALAAGFDRHLGKPLQPYALLHELTRRDVGGETDKVESS